MGIEPKPTTTQLSLLPPRCATTKNFNQAGHWCKIKAIVTLYQLDIVRCANVQHVCLHLYTTSDAFVFHNCKYFLFISVLRYAFNICAFERFFTSKVYKCNMKVSAAMYHYFRRSFACLFNQNAVKLWCQMFVESAPSFQRSRGRASKVS